MNNENDAFGKALMDFWEKNYSQGGDHFHHIERDDNYIEVSPTSQYFNFNHFNKWFEIEKQLLEKVNGGRTLDIGCGAGRHSIHLQRKGFNVSGIDPSPLAIKICKERGLDCHQASIEDLHKFNSKEWDFILMLGHNLGLLGDQIKAIVLFEWLYRIASDNCLILANCRDPYQTSNPYHLAYIHQNEKAGRMAGQIKIRARYKNLVGPWFEYLFLSTKELEQIIKQTPWKIKDLIAPQYNSSYGVILGK